MPTTVHKLNGLGNEFLVVLPRDSAGVAAIDLSAAAVGLCDRVVGPGGDGLITASWNGDDLVMVLHNADGSRAEMSGNGIRCLVHAVHRSHGSECRAPVTYRVLTDAGPRSVTILSAQGEEIISSVDMGVAETTETPAGWESLGCNPDRPVAHLSLGNPHSVVGVDDVGAVDLVALGAKVPQVNLEVVAPGAEPGTVRMRVHERGVGVTAACGTGACAVAVAARRWGLVPAGRDEVTVVMDGGSVTVRVDPTGAITLTGPTVWMGRFEVDW